MLSGSMRYAIPTPGDAYGGIREIDSIGNMLLSKFNYFYKT